VSGVDLPYDDDRTADLAAVLGMPDEEFARIFGAGRRESDGPVWHDFDSDPSGGLEAEVTPWFIAGDPPQLMARVFYHGVLLAIPEGSWRVGCLPRRSPQGHPPPSRPRGDLIEAGGLELSGRTELSCCGIAPPEAGGLLHQVDGLTIDGRDPDRVAAPMR